jgi:hypothetical protein
MPFSFTFFAQAEGLLGPSPLPPRKTDTEATAHIMPHCHWFASYTPCNVPICLANSKLVYAIGIGSVWFQPAIEGQQSRMVKLTKVLHVPLTVD